jgi:hypothetical protein
MLVVGVILLWLLVIARKASRIVAEKKNVSQGPDPG